MKAKLFNEIFAQLSIDAECTESVSQRYPDIPRDTIEAMFRRKYQLEMTVSTRALQKFTDEHLYSAVSQAQSLRSVASHYRVSPCLLARPCIRHILALQSDKRNITDLLKDPTKIPDPLLSRLIREEADPTRDLYHPDWDEVRRSHGEQYEQLMGNWLWDHNILYYTEEELRSAGYPKTPDYRLSMPVGLDGEPVCWVESKALFGEPVAHAEYHRTQYIPYVNRFGPGAVVYWHGFVDELDRRQEDGIMLFDGQTFLKALKSAQFIH